MKKTPLKPYGSVPITVVAGLIMAALVIPTSIQAAPKEALSNGNGNAFGHYVSQRFQEHLNAMEENFDWLPPGIAKRFFDDWGRGNGNGNGNGNGQDKIDPEFVELLLSNVTDTSAMVLAETDEPTTAELYLATSSGFAINDSTVTEFESDDLETEHEFMLDELTPQTDYYYRVMIEDEAGNETLSNEMSFMTLMESSSTDETAPDISNIETDTSDDTISVSWDTDELSDSVLYLSTSTPVDMDDPETIVVTDSDLVAEHLLEASGLEASTTYYGIVESSDAEGNTATSSEFEITTDAEPDTDAPIISNIEATSTTDSSFGVTWNTNEAADSVMYISTTTPVNPDATSTSKIEDTDLTTNHSLSATGLQASTTYYVMLESTDNNGNTATSSEIEITTEETPDTDAPIISDVSATSTSSTTIQASWTTDEPATSAIYTSTSTGFALTDAGVIVTENLTLTTGHLLNITGLLPATTYYHRIVSEDEAGNETVSTEITFGTD